MKTMTTLAFLFGLAVCSANVLSAQEEFPKPGPRQKLLAKMAGDWSSSVKFYPPGADEPVASKGEYKAEMSLGGYFLITTYKGAFGGDEFQGHGMTGYDPFEKKYTGAWADSMGPFIYQTEGQFDEAGRVYTETMEGPGPDGKPMKFHSVTRFEDENHMHYTLYLVGEKGERRKMMEIAHTRKKKK